jgi:hypothetical protein
MRRYLILLACVAIPVGSAIMGCQTKRPTSPATERPRQSLAPEVPSDDELIARPLYTFTEAELDRYLRLARGLEPSIPDRIVHLGRKNIGQPYEIFLLGEFPYEFHDPDPVYCLSKSDCLTFCEHTYSMALSRDWWTFLRTLQRIRYRDGVISMLTRNHHTLADWNRNNAFLFEDLTTRLGDGEIHVPLHQICRRADFFAQFNIGQDVADEPVEDRYIPKGRVPGILDELRNGDFVNIIRGDEKSQWCGHTGLIAIGDDGTVNFLHSARPAVREQRLVGYINGDRRCLGIKVLRLRSNAEQVMESMLAASPDATEVSEETLTAALARSPLMSTGAPPAYAEDWIRAMRLQSYRLTYDAPLDAELQRRLEEIDSDIAAKLGIPTEDRAFGVLDLTDRRLGLIQPDVMFYGASVPKICIVLAYFATHPDAAANLDPQTERELQLVIKRSDNELAAKYSQLVGLEQIQEILQSKRYHFYDQDHGGGFWCGKHYGIAEPRFGDPVHDHSHGATVRQCLRYYLMLEQGRLVSAAASARIKQIFAAPELEFHNDRFVRGLSGRDVTILRKSGLWEDWHLDTARVQHGERVYVLAGMAYHPKGSEYLTEMAAAVDEALCGPESPKPFTHHLMMYESANDFAGGTFANATLADHGLTLTCPARSEATSYESPVIETDMKFNEVVISTNIDTPAQAGFCIELRVGRRFDDSWSPWLYVSDWGAAVPGGERVTKCDLGYIYVDYFVSDQRFNRLQYRIRTANEGDHDTGLRVERVAVCVSDTSGIPLGIAPQRPAVEPPPEAAWRRRLPVPFRSQATDNPEMQGQLCSPTSVAMVMAYRGVDRPVEEVARTIYDHTHDIYGNWPRAIQAAYSYGVPGYLDRFSSWDEIKHRIAAGQPLIMSIRAENEGDLTGAYYDTTTGHLLVLTGFEDEDHIAVNDSAYRDPNDGQRTYLREDLEKVWMRSRGGLAYVLLPRE